MLCTAYRHFVTPHVEACVWSAEYAAYATGNETFCRRQECHAWTVSHPRPPGRVRTRLYDFRGGHKASPQGVSSFCVGWLGSRSLTVRHLTESGATPPSALALLLLLAFPLLLTLQNETANREHPLLYCFNSYPPLRLRTSVWIAYCQIFSNLSAELFQIQQIPHTA